MSMYSFNYHRPTTLDDAANDACRQRRRRVPRRRSDVDSDVETTPRGADRRDRSRRRRRTRRHRRERQTRADRRDDAACGGGAFAALRKVLPVLCGLAGQIGDGQVRNRGTIGGSVANSDPAADYPAAVIGLGATVHTNKRTIAAADYFKDLFETALEPGEILKAIEFPGAEARRVLQVPESGIALCGGRCAGCRFRRHDPRRCHRRWSVCVSCA